MAETGFNCACLTKMWEAAGRACLVAGTSTMRTNNIQRVGGWPLAGQRRARDIWQLRSRVWQAPWAAGSGNCAWLVGVVERARGGVVGRNIFVRVATCSLCLTQARPVLSTAQLLQPNRTGLGQASARVQGVAWWCARAGGRPRWVRMHRGRSVRNPNEPSKSCSEKWVGWRGEVCIRALQRIPP